MIKVIAIYLQRFANKLAMQECQLLELPRIAHTRPHGNVRELDTEDRSKQEFEDWWQPKSRNFPWTSQRTLSQDFAHRVWVFCPTGLKRSLEQLLALYADDVRCYDLANR